eukprot:270821-Pleurochrysis_carterae.AAC.1
MGASDGTSGTQGIPVSILRKLKLDNTEGIVFHKTMVYEETVQQDAAALLVSFIDGWRYAAAL